MVLGIFVVESYVNEKWLIMTIGGIVSVLFMLCINNFNLKE